MEGRFGGGLPIFARTPPKIAFHRSSMKTTSTPRPLPVALPKSYSCLWVGREHSSGMGLRKISTVLIFHPVTDNNFLMSPAASVTATTGCHRRRSRTKHLWHVQPGVTRNAVMQVTSAGYADRPAIVSADHSSAGRPALPVNPPASSYQEYPTLVSRFSPEVRSQRMRRAPRWPPRRYKATV